jgi:hypothetical protein
MTEENKTTARKVYEIISTGASTGRRRLSMLPPQAMNSSQANCPPSSSTRSRRPSRRTAKASQISASSRM